MAHNVTDEDRAAAMLRPIIGIENRTPQEVFDIMCDRISRRGQADFNAGLERAAELWERHKYNGSFGEVIRAEKESGHGA